MHLGRTGQRAGREGGPKHFHRRDAGVQHAFHIAHNVHHMAVAFHRKGLGHLDAANLGNAANVVAGQIDQHHMFGTLFGVVDQFLLDAFVFGVTARTGAGARQRTDRDLLIWLAIGTHNMLLPHQDFGRRAHHLKLTKVVKIHVRAGVERPQRPVQTQRRFSEAFLDALAHLHLHEVAVGDQLLGFFYGGNVVGLGKIAHRRVVLAGPHHWRLHRLLQQRFERAQAFFGIGVGFGLGRVGVHNQVQLARQVVDNGQFLALQQQDVGAAQFVGRAACFQLFLDVAHRVITKITGQTTTKPWQTRRQGHLEALLVAGDKVQRIDATAFHHHTIGDDLRQRLATKAAGTQQGAGRQADKAVAAKAFTTHHGFQQEAVGSGFAMALRELQVKGQWGFQVRKGFHHQGNAVETLGAQVFEFKLRDHGESPICDTTPTARSVRRGDHSHSIPQRGGGPARGIKGRCQQTGQIDG